MTVFVQCKREVHQLISSGKKQIAFKSVWQMLQSATRLSWWLQIESSRWRTEDCEVFGTKYYSCVVLHRTTIQVLPSAVVIG